LIEPSERTETAIIFDPVSLLDGGWRFVTSAAASPAHAADGPVSR
jgi:hypothetical protein